MKRIVFSKHTARRLKEKRQDGVTIGDVYAACHTAREILYKGVPNPLKLKGFTSEEGVKFDIVVVDHIDEDMSNNVELKVVTVIGTKYSRRRKRSQVDVFRLDHLPYKKRIKFMKKYQRMERKKYDGEITKPERPTTIPKKVR